MPLKFTVVTDETPQIYMSKMMLLNGAILRESIVGSESTEPARHVRDAPGSFGVMHPLNVGPCDERAEQKGNDVSEAAQIPLRGCQRKNH